MNGFEGVRHCEEDGYEIDMNNINIDELMNINIYVCMLVKCRLGKAKPLA